MLNSNDLTVKGILVTFIFLALSFFFPIFFNFALLIILMIFLYHNVNTPLIFIEDHCKITRKLLNENFEEIKYMLKETNKRIK